MKSTECAFLDKYREKSRTVDAYLDVVAVISNPAQYSRRYQLFEEFCARMKKTPTVRLLSVELQQRARPFETSADIKLRTKHEIWHKENLINIGVSHLPKDWEYVAWVDTDLIFQNENWARDTIEQLQSYGIVQLFTHAIDLGPKGETLQVHTGFGYQYDRGDAWVRPGYGKFWHPGYAWACRKSIYNQLGGLMDFPILGSADHHMALCFIGQSSCSLNHKLHRNYIELVKIFEERCERHLQRNIGYVEGTILHCFHGSKSGRQYKTRWNILVDNKFDPLRDIKKDNNNLWQLETNKFKLRDDIRHYFRKRNEDSIDLLEDYQFTKRN